MKLLFDPACYGRTAACASLPSSTPVSICVLFWACESASVCLCTLGEEANSRRLLWTMPGQDVTATRCFAAGNEYLLRNDEILAMATETLEDGEPDWVFNPMYDVGSRQLRGSDGAAKRELVVMYKFNHWPDGHMLFQFDSSVTTEMRGTFVHGMRTWVATSSVRFEPATSGGRLNFIQTSSCSSFIGRTGSAQTLQCGVNYFPGSLAHEVRRGLHSAPSPAHSTVARADWSRTWHLARAHSH